MNKFIDNYISSLSGAERELIEQMYELVYKAVPTADQSIYYGMPCLKYKGKGLIAIIANKSFISIYPFCAIKSLDINVSKYECTTGSIHIKPNNPMPKTLLKSVITARIHAIESSV